MSTEIQGTLVLNQISTDGGTTWKTIVCEETSQLSGTSSTNETRTKTCGVFTGVQTNAVQVTGSGVAGGDLATNQISYMDMQALRDAKTLIYFKRQNAANGSIAAGEITFAQFQGFITEATEVAAEGDIVKFNWAVTSTGTIDWTPGS